MRSAGVQSWQLCLPEHFCLLQISPNFPVFPGHGPDLLLTFPILSSSSHAVKSGPGQRGVKSDLKFPPQGPARAVPGLPIHPIHPTHPCFPAVPSLPGLCWAAGCGWNSSSAGILPQLEFLPSWNSSPAGTPVLQGERFKGCLKICFLLKLIQTDKPGWGKLQPWIFSPARRDNR